MSSSSSFSIFAGVILGHGCCGQSDCIEGAHQVNLNDAGKGIHPLLNPRVGNQDRALARSQCLQPMEVSKRKKSSGHFRRIPQSMEAGRVFIWNPEEATRFTEQLRLAPRESGFSPPSQGSRKEAK